jgi:dipeptidyl aminopeptidase/acylaminoacyl peptidase
MKRRPLALVGFILITICAARLAAQATPPTGPIAVAPRWIDSTSRLWYATGKGDQRSWFLLDADTGSRSPLFDPADLDAAARGASVEPLSPRITAARPLATGDVLLRARAEKNPWLWSPATRTLRPASAEEAGDLSGDLRLSRRPLRSRNAGPSTSLTFVNTRPGPVELFWITPEGERHSYGQLPPGQSREQHTYAGHAWVIVAPDAGDIGFVAGRDLPATVTIAEPPAADAPPRRRPDAAPVATPEGPSVVAHDNNLFLIREPGAPETPLTSDGTSESRFDTPALWSPDRSRFVAFRRTPGGDRKVTYIQSSPSDQLQPRVRTYDYLKPGDPIPQEFPCLFDAARATQVPIDTALFPNPWQIRDVHWAPDSSRFFFSYNQRGHTVMRVLSVDAATGAVTPLINEECPTFFDYAAKYFLHYLDRTDELLWMSERDGWNHLYLVNWRTGATSQVTSGPWVVRAVERVDEDARQVWFRTGGIDPAQDPYHVHFARINLDGTGLTRLTDADGTHRIEYSPDTRFYFDTYSRVDMPPVTEVRRSSDGVLVAPLAGPDPDARSPGQVYPERFVAKGRDGVTDIYGIIFSPPILQPGARYPVIEQIYAGPHDQHVPKEWRSAWGYAARLAEMGFFVVQIDGMGTNWRSKAFHDVAWKNLKDAGFPDRIAWIRAAAAAHPAMDLDNSGRGVGIFGGSAGGQNALAALLWHGDFYKVAVADCGCHDNRMDKIWWNELWMSWPVGPQYEESSNVVHARQLPDDCRILLIVGEMDENVDPASTMQVADALVKANKRFDMLVVPGAGHGAAETPYGNRRRTDFLVEHLRP